MNQTETSAHITGRLILAVADNDLAQVGLVLREALDQPGGAWALVLQLSSVAIEVCRAMEGDEWKSIMATALNDIETRDLSG